MGATGDKSRQVSDAFRVFLSEAPQFAQAWAALVEKLGSASALDEKTRGLAYLAVLASLNRVSGVAFHVSTLKRQGATREEVISAILVGLPAAGHVVTQALPAAIQAFDSDRDPPA
jgi:alkylhydroperoxidase/carboxymuconolactone decarboxylase family protein YurZ